MIQSFIVTLIVIAAAIYTAWIVMPASWRRAAAAGLAREASRSGLNQATARRIQLRLESTTACGECASCKGCAASGLNPAAGRKSASR